MQRFNLLKTWVESTLDADSLAIESASSDASFRRYFRVQHEGESYIVMDAPPSHEDVRPFLKVTAILAEAGMQVPRVYGQDIQQGLLLLGDLGSQDYLSCLNPDNANRLYGDALDALLAMQRDCPTTADLPAYNANLLQQEMALFRDWFLQTHLGLTLTAGESQLLDGCFAKLTDNALAQPRVCAHRDYHSRNLMVTATGNPGVLDFQDAVMGPVTYDLVSLLRDCYIRWPKSQVEQWAGQYHEAALAAGLIEVDQKTFMRWFDLMGMQRHLKAVGIFSRLNHRDHKPGYLNDIPRTLNYILEVAAGYPEFVPFLDFLTQRVVAGFDEQGLPLLRAVA